MIPKPVRLTILVLVLFFVGASAFLNRERARDWDRPLWVVIYPINADQSTASQTAISHLRESDFADMEAFFTREGQKYKIQERLPFDIKLAAEVNSLPPMPPEDGSKLSIMLWSLKLRYWAFRHGHDYHGLQPDIKLFVLYYDPAKYKTLPHSWGIDKIFVGVANVFAMDEMKGSNNVVIAHELLHIVGATDKYNLSTNYPLYPSGFAEPNRKPLYPQVMAEIMGGRIPISDIKAVTPRSLKETVVGPLTAKEINWVN